MAGFLVAQQISDLIARGVLTSHSDGSLGPASYQLRIGSYQRTQRHSPEKLSPGEEVVLRPGGLALIGVMEAVAFPNNIIGLLHLKSSFARRGLLPWSQGIIEPGYRGGITVVLHNHSGEYIPITGEESICHLMFQTTDEATNLPYEGSFQNKPAPTQGTEGRALKVIGELFERGVEGVTSGLMRST